MFTNGIKGRPFCRQRFVTDLFLLAPGMVNLLPTRILHYFSSSPIAIGSQSDIFFETSLRWSNYFVFFCRQPFFRVSEGYLGMTAEVYMVSSKTCSTRARTSTIEPYESKKSHGVFCKWHLLPWNVGNVFSTFPRSLS